MELRWKTTSKKTPKEVFAFTGKEFIYTDPVLQQKGMLDDGARFVQEWEDVPTVVIEE